MSAAVIFGAGSIGRGFLGASLSEAGWEVTFVDVVAPLVKRLNEDGGYEQVIVSNDGEERVRVAPVRAVLLGNDGVSLALGTADLVVTAVGAANLGSVAEALAAEARRRLTKGLAPLDVLVCENLPDAPGALRELIAAASSPEVASTVGLAATSIGRMVPVASVTEGLTTSVRVEPYSFLPYDAAALHAEPDVPDLVPVRDGFAFYEDRKLYIHNMGHCLLAYLGDLKGYEYTWQAVADPEIRLIVHGAMVEGASAVAAAHRQPMGPLLAHVDDLLTRFGNQALADTNERVGRDPLRKMQPEDRLLGSFTMCRANDVQPVHVTVGVALGAHRLALEPGWDLARATRHVEEHLFADDESAGLASLLRSLLRLLALRATVEAILEQLDDHYLPSRFF